MVLLKSCQGQQGTIFNQSPFQRQTPFQRQQLLQRQQFPLSQQGQQIFPNTLNPLNTLPTINPLAAQVRKAVIFNQKHYATFQT